MSLPLEHPRPATGQQPEAVAIEFLSDAKLADEVDAAQERGSLSKQGGDHSSKVLAENFAKPATLA